MQFNLNVELEDQHGWWTAQVNLPNGWPAVMRRRETATEAMAVALADASKDLMRWMNMGEDGTK